MPALLVSTAGTVRLTVLLKVPSVPTLSFGWRLWKPCAVGFYLKKVFGWITNSSSSTLISFVGDLSVHMTAVCEVTCRRAIVGWSQNTSCSKDFDSSVFCRVDNHHPLCYLSFFFFTLDVLSCSSNTFRLQFCLADQLFDFYSLTDVPLLHWRVSSSVTVMFMYFQSFRFEQPRDSGAGGKSAEWGECRSSGLLSPHPALLSPTGQKPLSHRTTRPSHVIAGMNCICLALMSSFHILKQILVWCDGATRKLC